jgi:putative membrane protein
MFHDAGLSFLHFTFAFIYAGALSAAAFVLRLPVDAAVARLLWRIDWIGRAGAVALLAAGLARVNFGARPWDYYEAQPFFWAKMAAFAVMGLMSIPPSLAYRRWTRAALGDSAFVVAGVEVKRVRRLVMIEVHLLALALAFAALMARGIGV